MAVDGPIEVPAPAKSDYPNVEANNKLSSDLWTVAKDYGNLQVANMQTAAQFGSAAVDQAEGLPQHLVQENPTEAKAAAVLLSAAADLSDPTLLIVKRAIEKPYTTAIEATLPPLLIAHAVADEVSSSIRRLFT